MIRIASVERYRENNRIEAKRALGGFPHSIWETYSAFANTLGGIILLGVEEHRDRSFHTVDLPDPEGFVEIFWRCVNDRSVVSANILTDDDVKIETVDGKRIVTITVPRAPRYLRPIYIGNDLKTGSYRRNGEGDYRCTPEELGAMVRDAAAQTMDSLPVPSIDPVELCAPTLKRFRADFNAKRSGHAWCALSDTDFLLRIGALCESDGMLCPTNAGLLAFGRREAILSHYPHFSLALSAECAFDGENLYDFYSLAKERLSDFLQTVTQDGEESTALRDACMHALSNAILHADYRVEGGVAVECTSRGITVSNPGDFRVDPSAAGEGGCSDPRNATLMRIFHTVRAAGRAGGGIPAILSLWQGAGFVTPVLTESFNPARVCLFLPFAKAQGRKTAPKGPGDELHQKAMAIDLLTDRITLTPDELAAALEIPQKSAKSLLQGLVLERIAVPEQGERDRFRLLS